VTIGEGRYMDGGVHSMTSADLVQRVEPDLVLIVAVFGLLDRGLHHIAARDLAAEAAALESAGASVRIVRFDEAAKAAAGGNLMDASARLPTADTGEAQGRTLGATLGAWWRGGEASGRGA
jgi:NTE family protein